jgi:multicomponent K+:H+ antiporter subunit A
MRIHPQYSIGMGLLLAGGAGCAAWVLSRNFLSNLTWHGQVPLIGELHLSSTLIFDIGVYLLVVGATVLMLIALAHQSLRSQRQRVETSTTRVLADVPVPSASEPT